MSPSSTLANTGRQLRPVVCFLFSCYSLVTYVELVCGCSNASLGIFSPGFLFLPTKQERGRIKERPFFLFLFCWGGGGRGMVNLRNTACLYLLTLFNINARPGWWCRLRAQSSKHKVPLFSNASFRPARSGCQLGTEHRQEHWQRQPM